MESNAMLRRIYVLTLFSTRKFFFRSRPEFTAQFRLPCRMVKNVLI